MNKEEKKQQKKQQREQQQIEIGNRIRNLRKELKLKQNDLAKRAYISNSDMSKIETGKKGIEPDQLKRIAQVLGCDTDHLVGSREELTKENTDIMAVLPLDEEAVELLKQLKGSCCNSSEAQYVSDLISYFIKALLSDKYGVDGVALGKSLADLSYWYEEEKIIESSPRLKEVLFHTGLKTRRYITAYKQDIREASVSIFTEFCKSRPYKGYGSSDDIAVDMITDEMYSAYVDEDMDAINNLEEEQRKRLNKIFGITEEVEKNGEEE